MLFDPYHFEYMRDEYERRAQAYRLQQAALAARATRAQTMAQLVSQGLRLTSSGIGTLWGWSHGLAQVVRWQQPTPGQPAATIDPSKHVTM